jgi:hypothetical protein
MMKKAMRGTEFEAQYLPAINLQTLTATRDTVLQNA